MDQQGSSDKMRFELVDGIVYVTYAPNAEISLEDAKIYSEKGRQQFGSERRLYYVDSTNMKSVSPAAREFYATQEDPSVVKAVAILTSTVISQVAGNLFVGLNQPKYPTKLFTSKEKALEWLRAQK